MYMIAWYRVSDSVCFVFFFKQKTAYEMRISDWSSDVCSTDLLGQQARLRLAEAHGLAAAALHLAHEEDPHADQQQHGQPGDQQAGEEGVVLDRLHGEVHAAIAQGRHQAVEVIGRARGEGAPIGVDAGDIDTLDRSD